VDGGQRGKGNDHPGSTIDAGPGGADRDRTDDPLLAKQVLSQLSYSPGFEGQRSEGGGQKSDMTILPSAFILLT
jgi:hypothetical protein